MLIGVRPERVTLLVLALGAGLAGLAGVVTAPYGVVTPTMWLLPLTQAFAIVILGGLGSVAGTVLAAIVIGFLDRFVAFNVQDGDIKVGLVTVAVILVTLVVRPSGPAREGWPDDRRRRGRAARRRRSGRRSDLLGRLLKVNVLLLLLLPVLLLFFPRFVDNTTLLQVIATANLYVMFAASLGHPVRLHRAGELRSRRVHRRRRLHRRAARASTSPSVSSELALLLAASVVGGARHRRSGCPACGSRARTSRSPPCRWRRRWCS